MENTHTLLAGQRFLLQEEEKIACVLSGVVEVYAVTRTGEELSFRQCYLLAMGEGEAVFPAMDEFNELYLQLYAKEDTAFSLCPLEEMRVEELRPMMEHWFRRLVEISWLRQKADKGDDMLQAWRQEGLLADFASPAALLAEFRENQQILSMFLGMQFGAEDKRLSRRIRVRKMAKKMMVENGIRGLLGEEQLFAGLIPLATPIITETIFQDIIPILDRQGLATVTQALMVTSFTTAALGIVRSIAVMRISSRIEISAEAAMWGRLMQLPTKFFRRFIVGELASRMGASALPRAWPPGSSSAPSFPSSFPSGASSSCATTA